MNNGPVTAQASSASRASYAFLFSPAWMVAIGLIVRIGCILTFHLHQIDVTYWTKFEMVVVGRSLAVGEGFSAPWGGGTGPTSWLAPIYPWLVSLFFRVFGVYSQASIFALLTFSSLFSAFTSLTIFRIASRLFDRRVAAWSGWIWAVFPTSIFWSVGWIWETAFSAFLLSLLFLITLQMEGEDRLWPWFRYGLLWGVAALTSPALLSWLPFSGCWLAYKLALHNKRFVLPALLGAAVFWSFVTPWIVRDYFVMHKLIFIRDELGCELRAGNNPDAGGSWDPAYQAGANPVMFAKYKALGEVGFCASQGRLAKQWISENPDRFLTLIRIRIFRFWFIINEPQLYLVRQVILLCLTPLSFAGLALCLWRRIHAAFLFAALMAFYPLVYYITFPTDRYHHAIEPELVILAVYCIASEASPSKSRSKAIATDS